MSTENREGTDSVPGDSLFDPHLLLGLEFVNPLHRVFRKMAVSGSFVGGMPCWELVGLRRRILRRVCSLWKQRIVKKANGSLKKSSFHFV